MTEMHRATGNKVLRQLLYHYTKNGGFQDAPSRWQTKTKESSTGRINTSPQYSGTVNCSVSLVDSLLSFTYGIILYQHRKICHKIRAQNNFQMQQNVDRNTFRSKRGPKLQDITQMTLMTELK